MGCLSLLHCFVEHDIILVGNFRHVRQDVLDIFGITDRENTTIDLQCTDI